MRVKNPAVRSRHSGLGRRRGQPTLAGGVRWTTGHLARERPLRISDKPVCFSSCLRGTGGTAAITRTRFRWRGGFHVPVKVPREAMGPRPVSGPRSRLIVRSGERCHRSPRTFVLRAVCVTRWHLTVMGPVN